MLGRGLRAAIASSSDCSELWCVCCQDLRGRKVSEDLRATSDHLDRRDSPASRDHKAIPDSQVRLDRPVRRVPWDSLEAPDIQVTVDFKVPRELPDPPDRKDLKDPLDSKDSLGRLDRQVD